ncbi:MAG: AraC family ligand binding domain-containing protein, partial [Candidatus Weimeria sp.]
MKKQRKNIEFRYYDIPKGEYVLPEINDSRINGNGKGLASEDLHFHNFMEIGYCDYGDGELIIEDRKYKYERDNFSIIPKNVIHTTILVPGHNDKWEYLFVDIDSFIR